MHQDPLWTTQEAVWRGHGPSHTSVGHTGNTHHGRSTVGQERTLRPLGLLAGVASSTGPVLGAQEAAALTPHTYLKATDTVHITGFMPYLPYRVGRHLPHNTLPIPFPRNTHTHTHTHTRFYLYPRTLFPTAFRETGRKEERERETWVQEKHRLAGSCTRPDGTEPTIWAWAVTRSEPANFQLQDEAPTT